jgi:hypothetical protein
MKLLDAMVRWATLAGVAAATVASAQPEQWLQYRSGDEGRSYRWLELTTNPPPNVALPKLSGPAYFARWTTPLDPAGCRWICFDRTRKSGPWNRVYADRNGNGQLTDEQPADAVRTDQYSAYFDPLRFVFKGEDGRVVYHLVLRFLKYDNDDVRLLAMPGCTYSGKVDLGGKKRLVALVDGNVNGVFNDVGDTSYESDRILVEGDKTAERIQGRLLEVDDQLFQVETARDGAFLKIKKAENVTLGLVRLPASISEITAVGEDGHFVRKPAQGEFKLPIGKYRVHAWAIERKDTKGALWKLEGTDLGAAGRFEVRAAKPVTIEVGEPIWPVLSATESKGNIAFGLRLKGRLGEPVEMTKDGQRPRAPRLLLAGNGNAFHATNTFEYG